MLSKSSSQSTEGRLIKVFIPSVCVNEQRYILDVMLGEFFGLAFEVFEYNGLEIKITQNDSAACLTLNVDFFQQSHQNWLGENSMPHLPLANWKPVDDGIVAATVKDHLPVLFGESGLIKNHEHWHLNVDVFGSAFFMLSRYEELVTVDRDNHDRFPARASIAYKCDFLNRPIVNEYLEVLWFCLSSLWPDLKRKSRSFRKLISCDVDHPFDPVGHSFKRTITRVGARLIRDKNPKLALYDSLNFVFKLIGSDRFDQYRQNIDWMMELNQKQSNKVAFYFIPIQTDPSKEDNNNVRSNKISSLLKHIVKSGHEVGLHPGYRTYRFPDNFRQSADALKAACQSQGVDTSALGGRQHYLCYDIGQTPALWQQNGLAYDSSLSFADKAGFRAGVCYEFTMYNLLERKKMKLKQRPLIVMECTLISRAYENLGLSSAAIERFAYFENMCKTFNGDYVLLWHNSFFSERGSKDFYAKVIK
jgi:hypothetical protein